jgi:hypothetical protein
LLDRQVAALEAADCIRIFADKKPAKDAEREELGSWSYPAGISR